MPTDHEKFWTNASFAFVGHSARKGFPKLSYRELRKQGKKVFAVDPSVDAIDGDRAYPDLESLPEKVEAVVLEVPREETEEWVRRAADAGVTSVWIHMNRETPEAVALARERGLDLVTGTCAVMYVKPGFSYHSIHKWLNQLTGRY
jgi:predicted CoA-binding protein